MSLNLTDIQFNQNVSTPIPTMTITAKLYNQTYNTGAVYQVNVYYPTVEDAKGQTVDQIETAVRAQFALDYPNLGL